MRPRDKDDLLRTGTYADELRDEPTSVPIYKLAAATGMLAAVIFLAGYVTKAVVG